MCVCILECFRCTVYMLLYLYDLFHTLQSLLTYIGSRDWYVCNVCMYVGAKLSTPLN
jgi:hypothetical protein